MKILSFLGLVALLPAALNTAPAAMAANGRIVAVLCTGDGAARAVSIPLKRGPGRRGLPLDDPPGCCAKGCHASGRKRGCCDAAPGTN